MPGSTRTALQMIRRPLIPACTISRHPVSPPLKRLKRSGGWRRLSRAVLLFIYIHILTIRLVLWRVIHHSLCAIYIRFQRRRRCLRKMKRIVRLRPGISGREDRAADPPRIADHVLHAGWLYLLKGRRRGTTGGGGDGKSKAV